MNILLVDDEKIQIKALTIGLKNNGHSVFIAYNVRQALDILERMDHDIDIVVTDYMMVGESGLDLLKIIRRKFGILPVIMMTAYGKKKLVIDAMRNQCNGFIEKPFTLNQLMEEITRAQLDVYQNTASDELSKLVPQIIHQVNNPLMSIMASATLAARQIGNTEEISKYMDSIIEDIRDIKKLNNRLSNLGRSASMRLEKLEIISFLKYCVRKFSDLMTLKNIRLVDNCASEGDLFIQGNPFDLEQALKNLILNAIDAMDGRDKKKLKIFCRQDKKGSVVFLNIADTGCGIPPDKMDTIFTQYYTSKEHGTGLGLHVAKTIIERHGGMIQVDSEPDEQTVFTVVLPLYGDRE